MNFCNIHFIVNSASGKEEPILTYINRVFGKSDVDWDISVTKKGRNAAEIARKLINKTDLIVVYGGDGCVTQVAGVLQNTNMPMAIIPGGTANVMAKQLCIPQDSLAALEMLGGGKMQVKTIDMGRVNGIPFLLRINLGIMAQMVLQADRQMKNSLGQLAYGVSAVQAVASAETMDYQLKIDGEPVTVSGVSLTVTNSGNIGIGDFSLLPGISISDGLLDVILLKDNNFTSLLKVAGSTLLQTDTDAYTHWQCKSVIVQMDEEQPFICDDAAKTAKELAIEIVPASLRILVPAAN